MASNLSRKLNVTGLLVGFGFMGMMTLGCRTKMPEPAQMAPPSQRVAARTVSHLGLVLDQVSLATVSFAGTSYAVRGFDSVSYRYDDRRRLVSLQGVGTSQAYGKKFSYPYGGEFIYEQRKLIAGSGNYRAVYPLDSTEHRILSRNGRAYSLVIFDTLRRYSNEGILISSLQGDYNPTFPDTKREVPNLKATIQAGNVVRLEEYSPWSGKLELVTLCSYDLQHYAPLATETYLGETSRNTLRKKTILNPVGVVLNEYLYANEYDQQGRLVRQLESLRLPTTILPKVLSLTRYYY